MSDLIIIGAGDFAREVAWLVNRINDSCHVWNLLGFVDDFKVGQMVDGYPVLGSVNWLSTYTKKIHVVCAIGNSSARKKIWETLSSNQNISLATLLDPNSVIGPTCSIGEGCIICAGAILTINASLGTNCIVNLNCTVGHDAILDDYCTLHPNVNISGRVHVGECCVIGTGSQIIQGLEICAASILGAGSVVSKTISTPGTYVGIPARRVK